MSARRKNPRRRFRVGRVSVYYHHGAWWVYHRDGGRQVRRKIGLCCEQAEKIAAQVNAQLAAGAPSLLSFDPIGLADLRLRFLEFHEQVLKSSVATIGRYRAATQHLEDFTLRQSKPPRAHEVRPEAFAANLRMLDVSPNGHPNTLKRRLRDKGIQFILETCRAMYTFANKRRHLPPYAGIPSRSYPSIV